MTEQEILTYYSTSSLHRGELTRASKKAHLQTVPRITPEEIEEVLEQLYPPESTVPKDAPACEGEDAEFIDIELLAPAIRGARV